MAIGRTAGVLTPVGRELLSAPARPLYEESAHIPRRMYSRAELFHVLSSRLRMANSEEAFLPSQRTVPVKNMLWRASGLAILSLLISLLCYRLSLLHRHGFIWLAAFLCESWFTYLWLLSMNAKWNQVKCVTYPERVFKRHDDLPAVDMFVTTADPKLESPILTVNTVLSMLAVEYPAHKLACYVSDDACSSTTYYALVEAAEFARFWVPFCKKHNVRVRAPFRYFSENTDANHSPSPDFQRDWQVMKNKYEKLVRRIEEETSRAPAKSPWKGVMGTDELSTFESGDHPSVLKILWENSDGLCDGVPHLIYVSREKRPKYPHHYKAGAMNALVRVSAVMTNAPFLLNVDCDMFANNPEVVIHGLCVLLGHDSERNSGFVQTPQQFYGGIRDDPFGNQHVVLMHYAGMGINGLGCQVYMGTGCFHRRKAIYGEAPKLELEAAPQLDGAKGTPSPLELERRFGSSRDMQESAVLWIASTGEPLNTPPAVKEGLAAKAEAAKSLASCTYEVGTCWGREVGWVYGSVTEDIMTGLRIHAKGWRSVFFTPEPPAFLGCAPISGPATMTQYKRWSTGLLEFMVSKNGPFLAALTRKISLRHCLAYEFYCNWPLRSVPELCYALLAPYCAFTSTSFQPKVSEPAFVIPALLFVLYNVYTLMEYLKCRLSVRTWWNNQRMQRIQWTSSSLFGMLSALTKLLGMSETTFELTPKEQTASSSPEAATLSDPGRFAFDSSLIYLPGTALVFLNSAAAAVILLKLSTSLRELTDVRCCDGPGIGELVCSVWVVLSFWPFVRGIFGEGSYGLPWSTIVKGSIVSLLFLAFCEVSNLKREM